MILIKLQSNFTEITFAWVFPVNLLHIFRTIFLKNTSPVGKKTSTRCLTKTSKTSCQDILQMSKRCLKCKSERHLRKTSSRYLCKIYCRCLTKDVLLIYLEDALKLSEDVSWMSYRRWLTYALSKDVL